MPGMWQKSKIPQIPLVHGQPDMALRRPVPLLDVEIGEKQRCYPLIYDGASAIRHTGDRLYVSKRVCGIYRGEVEMTTEFIISLTVACVALLVARLIVDKVLKWS